MTEAPALSDNLKAARGRLGLSQAQVAERIGVHVMSVSGWERGRSVPGDDHLRALATLYGTSPAALRYGAEDDTRREPYSPRPSTRRLPPPVFAVVHGYLEQMERAGCSEEMLDEAERLMVDWNFSKLHKRDPRDRTTDEMIVDVRAIWSAIEETLREDGVKL